MVRALTYIKTKTIVKACKVSFQPVGACFGAHLFCLFAVGFLSTGAEPWLERAGYFRRRTALRMPSRMASGAGGQPGMLWSTGITLATRPQLA